MKDSMKDSMKAVRINTNKLPDGIYIMNTVSEEQYYKNSAFAKEAFFKRNKTPAPNTSAHAVQKNLSKCNQMFKVIRKPISGIYTNISGNFIENNSLLPNVLIKQVWNKEEGRILYPEFFL